MEQKPQKTLADYLMVAISPALIMLVVGSLAFFLIQVFYRGAMVHGIRWVMFWFVLAIVLVSRIGIEQGKTYGRIYGAALAVAMWFYLAHTHNVPFLGALLLALTWWCAHVLTVDCTLISEDEDSGEGVLQGMWRKLEKSLESTEPVLRSPKLTPLEILVAENLARRHSQKPARPPGRSVVYFSLAALPLFGVGQLFLPADDPHARRVGFAFLALYLGAALSLLVSTSFLGLRRYLRQRSVEMPTSVAVGWVRFGAVMIAGVLAAAMILPRPGANYTWKELAYRKEQKEEKASELALPFNPPGEGEGTPTQQPVERNSAGVDSRKPSVGSATHSAQNDRPTLSNPQSQSDQSSNSEGGAGTSGNRGSSGREGKAGDNSQSSDENRATQKTTLHLKDLVPSGSGDQSNNKDQPGAPGDGEPKGGGSGGQVVSSGQSPQSGKSGKELTDKPTQQPKPPLEKDKPVIQSVQDQPEKTAPAPKPPSDFLQKLLRVLLMIALAALLIWALIRYRKPIAEMIRAFLSSVRVFLRKLFSFRFSRRKTVQPSEPSPQAPVLQPFTTYENPFVVGKDKLWPPERLLFYTYEVLQAWAKEQGIVVKPQQTPREFCCEVIEHFPDFGPEMEQFSFYYAHAAFAERLPDDFETDSIRRLWEYLGDSVATVTVR